MIKGIKVIILIVSIFFILTTQSLLAKLIINPYDSKLDDSFTSSLFQESINNDTTWYALISYFGDSYFQSLEICDFSYSVIDYNKYKISDSIIFNDSIFKVHLKEYQIHLINKLIKSKTFLRRFYTKNNFVTYYFDVTIPNYFKRCNGYEACHGLSICELSPRVFDDNRINATNLKSTGIVEKIWHQMNMPNCKFYKSFPVVGYTKADSIISYQKIRYKIHIKQYLDDRGYPEEDLDSNSGYLWGRYEINRDSFTNRLAIEEDSYEIIGDTIKNYSDCIKVGNMSLGKSNDIVNTNNNIKVNFERYKRKSSMYSFRMESKDTGYYCLRIFSASGYQSKDIEIYKPNQVFQEDLSLGVLEGRVTYEIYEVNKKYYDKKRRLKLLLSSFFDYEEIPIDSEKPGYK